MTRWGFASDRAFLARMHENGVLYLLVPFSPFLLALLLDSYGILFPPMIDLGWSIIPAPISFGFAELAAFFLSFPLLFAVMNPTGIARGLAAAALGFAFACVGINAITGEVRYVFGQPALWEGLPLNLLLAGLFAIPIGAALALAGYTGRWDIPVRVTTVRRAFLLVTGTALMLWPLREIVLYRNIPLAVSVVLAFACIGLLMQRYRWPRLPLLFGVMVGHQFEKNFLSAVSAYDLSSVLVRPCSAVLATTVLAAAGLSYYLSRSNAPSTEAGPTGFRLAALLQQRNVVPALGVAAGVTFVWGSLGFEDVYTWFLPRVAGLAVAGLCLLELVFSMREPMSRTIPSEEVSNP